MEWLLDLLDLISRRRVPVMIAVGLALLGWATSSLIDGTDAAVPVEESTEHADVAPAEISAIPNWGTAVPPTPESAYFPPIPPSPPPEMLPEESAKEYVARQANYLRTAGKEPRFKAAFGNLTDQQIAEMEKNGVTIW